MPQAVEIEGQTEQQGLANLGREAATRCFRGELAFDDREHRFYFGAWPIQFVRKLTVHLVANFFVGDAAPASGNDTACSHRGADVPVIVFRVELRVGQHQADGVVRLAVSSLSAPPGRYR
jgi:hypothetical protein